MSLLRRRLSDHQVLGDARSSLRDQKRLRDEDLRSYAERPGLDLDLFDKDLSGHAHAARVHEDFMSGARSGVNGTLTFYIDGVRYDDSYELDTLLPALARPAVTCFLEANTAAPGTREVPGAAVA